MHPMQQRLSHGRGWPLHLLTVCGWQVCSQRIRLCQLREWLLCSREWRVIMCAVSTRARQPRWSERHLLSLRCWQVRSPGDLHRVSCWYLLVRRWVNQLHDLRAWYSRRGRAVQLFHLSQRHVLQREPQSVRVMWTRVLHPTRYLPRHSQQRLKFCLPLWGHRSRGLHLLLQESCAALLPRWLWRLFALRSGYFEQHQRSEHMLPMRSRQSRQRRP